MLRWSEINWRTSDKTCLYLVILTNESRLTQDLDYTINLVNLKYNIFLNKLVRMRFVLTIYNIHFCWLFYTPTFTILELILQNHDVKRNGVKECV